jgi:hypothetical protein
VFRVFRVFRCSLDMRGQLCYRCGMRSFERGSETMNGIDAAFAAIVDASYTSAEQLALALWADSMQELQERARRRGWSEKA